LSKTAVVGLGALNIDYIYKVERILEDGEAIVNDAAVFPGGSAANTIYGLAKLGVSTGFIGAVADDAEGQALLEDLRKTGADTSQVRVKPGAKTGSTLCLSDEMGRRSIYVLPGANSRLTIKDLNLNYLNQAGWLHISSFVDEAQFKMLLELMEKLGPATGVSFSPGALYAARGLNTLKPILARTHILFINRSELRQLTGDEVTSGAETCLKQGCRMVVVTLGKGAVCQSTEAVGYIMNAENEYLIESSQPDTPALDTTGAGDAFAAGFLYGFLKGKGIEECGHLGDMVARFSIAKIGARQGLPTLDELSRRYRQLYGKQL
jgi:ribokinase